MTVEGVTTLLFFLGTCLFALRKRTPRFFGKDTKPSCLLLTTLEEPTPTQIETVSMLARIHVTCGKIVDLQEEINPTIQPADGNKKERTRTMVDTALHRDSENPHGRCVTLEGFEWVCRKVDEELASLLQKKAKRNLATPPCTTVGCKRRREP